MIALALAWLLYIWIRAPTFGSHLIGGGLHNCNHHVKYILLFIEVRATVPWLRWFIVAGLGSQVVTALAMLPVGFSAMADENSSNWGATVLKWWRAGVLILSCVPEYILYPPVYLSLSCYRGA